MLQRDGLNRRAFLKNAGMTAVVSAVGTRAGLPAAAAAAAPASPAGSRYDFAAVYSRVGTDCTKWDRQIGIYGKDKIAVGMGIADMDFKAAPCITRALAERLQHENWGYLTIPASHVESI